GVFFFFSSRRRHTRSDRDWSSDVCSSDLAGRGGIPREVERGTGKADVVELLGHVHSRPAVLRLADEREARLRAVAVEVDVDFERSEERRVGKECRSRW